MTAVESAPRLRAWILEQIRRRGPLRFDEFMQAALYHPEHGYYCRPGAAIGTRGDFRTSPGIHPAFGCLIARQIAEIIDRTIPDDRPFRLIEMGPGEGTLAHDIASGLSTERPDLAARVRYTLVEISPALREVQRRRLEETRVEWLSWNELLDVAGSEGLDGCVVANEFLDALPVQRLEASGGKLREVSIGMAGPPGEEKFTEVLTPPDGQVVRHFEALAEEDGIHLQEGQRVEAGLFGLEWVSSLGRLFGAGGRGGVILIDYGYPARELYSPTRSAGTLMCYRNHQVADDPLAHVGEQDITTHVNFTAVASRGRQAGLDVSSPVSQMSFLVALGLAGMVAGKANRNDAGSLRERLALHSLMAPGGMGEIFKVIMMTRGTGAGSLTGARNPFR